MHCKKCDARFRPPRIDEYVLLDELGHGAFSAVHLAYDLRNYREVALKQLDENSIPQQEFDSWTKRAIAEARALAAIGFHPNVLPLYTSGRFGQTFYLVTPVIWGQSLDKIIPEDGFADPLRAVELGSIILRALHHVHAFKIHHRDVKPSNIMIAKDGHLFLIDFGLVACRRVNTSLHTELGTVLGTAAYVPPEQARGELDRVGPWSDQYGAGVVLYKMLTGNVPYPSGNAYAVVAAVGDYKKLPLPLRYYRPELDAELEALVMKALSKFPGERFKSCAEFADVLQDWSARWKSRRSPVLPPSRPNWRAWAVKRLSRCSSKDFRSFPTPRTAIASTSVAESFGR